MKRYVFDDWKSWVHFIAGAVSVLLSKLGLWPVGVAVLGFFLWYQLREKENPEKKIGDFVEYLTGVALGVLVPW